MKWYEYPPRVVQSIIVLMILFGTPALVVYVWKLCDFYEILGYFVTCTLVLLFISGLLRIKILGNPINTQKARKAY